MQLRTDRRLGLEPCEARTMLSAAPVGTSDLELLWQQSLAQAIEEAGDLRHYSSEELSSTEQWVVGLSGGWTPEQVTPSLGGEAIGPTAYLDNSYVWEFSAEQQWEDISSALASTDGVLFYYPLVAFDQVVRSLPDDPLFSNEWHLVNTYVPGEDINVASVWDVYQGDGVVIGMIDDGLDLTHVDLAAHYRSDLSYDINFDDPNPQHDGAGEGHGTAAAGVAAAVGNNGQGVAGVAYDAQLAAIRLVSAATTDSQEAQAVTYQYQEIDIYNNSWGPADGTGRLTRPGPLLTAALRDGVTNGRGGLGNIYTWAAGNGGLLGDNVNYDGYANSRYTVAVAALDRNGVQAAYSEKGAALLVSAYAGGASDGLTTTDWTGSGGFSASEYSYAFNGTSAATPVVSGVVALMLQANPNLSYRDVQHILVRTARQNDAGDSDWATNGAGLHVNHKYGFGAVDAAAAVALAESWTPVGPEACESSGVVNVNQAIPDNNSQGLSSTISLSGTVTDVEWVEVVVDADHTFWGDLEVVLVSPEGTRSVLAEAHGTADEGGFDNWTFTTSRNWGETSQGDWKLEIRDRASGDTGTFNHWELRVYGTNAAADLGTVDYRTLAGIDLTAGDAWYRFDAAHAATFSAAVQTSGSSTASLALYDADLQLLAGPTAAGGQGRLDYAVSAGETYLLRLSGSAAQASLRLVNLLEIDGSAVTVHGSGLADDFEFSPDGGVYTVWINGLDYTLDPALVASVAFDGGEGDDVATLTGLATADFFALDPGSAQLTADELEVSVTSAADIAVYGGGGDDVALLADSPGDDLLHAWPDDVWLMQAGVYSNRAFDFGQVVVQASAGGDDEAFLYDSSGDDLFTASPGVARMLAGGVLLRALAFERVHGLFQEGGFDTARLYDSEGDDTLVASPSAATLSGPGYALETEGYSELYVVADRGDDRAELTGSTGADTFYSLPGDARLWSDGAYFLRVREFETVAAEAGGGDGDAAWLSGGDGVDAYVGSPTQATLTSPGHTSEVSGFDEVIAVGRGGRLDTAELHGSAAAEIYTANSLYGRLAGGDFMQRAGQFETVTTYGGADDVARFYDSPFDDALTTAAAVADFRVARLSHHTEGFGILHVLATSGGYDVAHLTGSALADTLLGNPSQTKLFSDDYYVRAAGFDAVYADGGPGDDTAELLDSSGADTLQAGADWVQLSDAALSYLIRAAAFEHVLATSPGDADSDTAPASLVLPYDLRLAGTWESLS